MAGVTDVALSCVQKHLKELQDRTGVFAVGQSLHGRADQIELLLEVVETDLGVDPVPVKQFVFNQS